MPNKNCNWTVAHSKRLTKLKNKESKTTENYSKRPLAAEMLALAKIESMNAEM